MVLKFMVQSLWFMVQSLWFKVYGFKVNGFKVNGSKFMIYGWVYDSQFMADS
jgi:hypothetical protein